jgi:hypothetical protein
VRSPARRRGGPFFSRHAQPVHEAAPGGDTDAKPPSGVPPLTPRRSRGIGLVLDEAAPHRQGGGVTGGGAAAAMGERRHGPAGPPPAQQLFTKRLAATKELSNGALGAQSGITGATNFLSEVEGIGVHP